MLNGRFEEIKKELLYVGIALIGLIVILKVAFYKESLFVVLKMALSLFWLFIVPGYFLMLFWKERLDFVSRFVLGTALCFAVMGILSYYAGLLGLHIKYHVWIFPPLLILLGGYLWVRKK